VALDHPKGQDWESTARDVHADVLRLARLAEDLLLLARLDERAGAAGAGEADAGGAGAGGAGARAARGGATVDLAELSESVAARYAAARVPVVVMGAAEPGSGPVAGTGAAPFLVAGDRDAIDRLLVNLIDNAVRYAKSQVTVAVRREDAEVTLTVTDDGPGVPDADLERAFDRFARLDDARSRDGDEGGGAGLGLAIVRATAQAYGGTAHLEPGAPAASPPGLRAVVRLPATALPG
jgi:signal transduction histidine kinase